MQTISSKPISPRLNFNTLFSPLLLSLCIMGCADIKLQPKDPELLALGNFADQATVHLFEVNPDTYEQYQSLLNQEIAPHVLSQLKERGACAKSAQEAKQAAKAMLSTKEKSVLQIESTTFPSRATSQGLVPVEVKGSCVKSHNGINKVANFDILYLVGTNIKTKKPILASIEIKKFN